MPCCFIDEGFTLYLEDRKLKLPIKFEISVCPESIATPKLLHGLGVPFYHESSCPLPVNGSGSSREATQQYLLKFFRAFVPCCLEMVFRSPLLFAYPHIAKIHLV